MFHSKLKNRLLLFVFWSHLILTKTYIFLNFNRFLVTGAWTYIVPANSFLLISKKAFQFVLLEGYWIMNLVFSWFYFTIFWCQNVLFNDWPFHCEKFLIYFVFHWQLSQQLHLLFVLLVDLLRHLDYAFFIVK